MSSRTMISNIGLFVVTCLPGRTIPGMGREDPSRELADRRARTGVALRKASSLPCVSPHKISKMGTIVRKT